MTKDSLWLCVVLPHGPGSGMTRKENWVEHKYFSFPTYVIDTTTMCATLCHCSFPDITGWSKLHLFSLNLLLVRHFVTGVRKIILCIFQWSVCIISLYSLYFSMVSIYNIIIISLSSSLQNLSLWLLNSISNCGIQFSENHEEYFSVWSSFL